MNFFDLHCDTATEAMKIHAGLCKNGLQLDLNKLKEAKLCQSYAVYIPDTLRGEAAWHYFAKCSDYWKERIAKTAHMDLLQKPAEVKAQWQRGQHGCFMAVEGGAVLAGRLEYVENLAGRGVRMLTLTWNGENELASGAAASGGLKPFGRDVLRELERCNIVADVSHLNDESFWDVIERANRPVIGSHSNSRKLCNVPRNLTDDQFRCIAEHRGLVGLNFFTGFLREEKEDARLEDILRHAEHFLHLGGEDVLALGSDFDGAEMPCDLPDCGALPELAEKMTTAFGTVLAEKICYKNALAFWQRWDAI